MLAHHVPLGIRLRVAWVVHHAQYVLALDLSARAHLRHGDPFRIQYVFARGGVEDTGHNLAFLRYPFSEFSGVRRLRQLGLYVSRRWITFGIF